VVTANVDGSAFHLQRPLIMYCNKIPLGRTGQTWWYARKIVSAVC